MKVTIHSRQSVKALLEKGKIEDSAVISFYDPEGRSKIRYAPIDYTGVCERVMQIPLHDLDPAALHSVGLTVDTYFPEAKALAEFIYRARADGLNIICQCEYGQSRSAGCAAAILQHFSKNGIEVFADYRYYPNQLVYHKVFDALEEYKKKNM